MPSNVSPKELALVAHAASVPARHEAAPWTAEQLALVKRTVCPGEDQPSDSEFALFVAICRRTGLDPLMREVFLVPRRSKTKTGGWTTSWQSMVARDGYLHAAHRSGELRGIETLVYPENPTQPPTHATCRVWRLGWEHPVAVTVGFAEYVQTTQEYADGRPTGKRVPTEMWRTKPRTMIAKVVEAHALRRAFDLHGTYSPEEVPADESDRAERPEPVVAALAFGDARVINVEPDAGRGEADGEADGDKALKDAVAALGKIDSLPHLRNHYRKHVEQWKGFDEVSHAEIAEALTAAAARCGTTIKILREWLAAEQGSA